MIYTPTLWTNDSLPAIDAANLTNIENALVTVAAGGRTGVQAGSLASEHAGLPIGVQLPLNATLIWTDSNMGSNSGLDADKLWGHQAAYFMPVTGTGGAVSFTGAVQFSNTTTVTVAGSLTVSGSLSVTGGGSITVDSISVNNTCTAGAFNVSSTRDIKNVHGLVEDRGVDVVINTPIYRYALKADPEQVEHVGFIVEDSPMVIVGENKKSIDLYAALAYSYKAIQELTARIELLERNK